MNSGDFVFRFSLDDLERSSLQEGDPLNRMIYHFLKDIQQIGYLCSNGKRVHIDGFVLNNEPETVHPLFPDAEVKERG
jgi:hypothetical protein